MENTIEQVFNHLRSWGRYECDVCCNDGGNDFTKAWAVELNSTASHAVLTCKICGKAILFDMKYVLGG